MTEPEPPVGDDSWPVPQPDDGEGWQRLHPATIADDVLQRLPSVVIGLFLILTSGERDSLFELIQLVAGFGALAPVVVRYLTGRYRVGPELLQWRVGVFKKVATDMPRHRIQSVDTRINIIGRIFGLETVIVSSAGGEGEVTIGLVVNQEADRLRAELSPETVRVTVVEPVEGDSTEVRAAPVIPETDLAILNASDLPRVMLVNLGQLMGFVGLVTVCAGAVIGVSIGILRPGNLVYFLPVLIGVFALGAGVATKAIGFSSELYGDRIRVARGIVTRTRFEAPLARVQGVTIRCSVPARWIGTEAISVDTADVSGTSASQQTLVHPIAPVGQWKKWVPLFLGIPVPDPREFHRVAPVSLRRRWIVVGLWAVGLWAIAGIVAWLLIEWIGRDRLVIGIAVTVGVFVPLASGLVKTLGYRNERWTLGDEAVAFRRGAFTMSLVIVPRVRIQGVQIRANWFQRRLGVANILVDTASPTVVGKGRDLYLTDAATVANGLLASIDEGGGV
ncbi:MAG: PH domain-containing protein [Actinomycetota bacterium]|nr:PH domain-containing protein [Actinomycetota bacterium]